MEKTREDNRSEVYECLRCHQDYCTECNNSVEIDFDFDEKEDDSIVTKGDDVCPYCYNQLLKLNTASQSGGN